MAEKDPHVIGARIAKRRHQLDWSQVELAGRLGVSPSTVANWERGASYPKKKLGKVEHVLGIPIDGEPTPEPEPLVPRVTREGIMSDPELSDEERAAVLDAVERQLASERGAAPSSVRAAGGASRRRPASLAGATGRR